MDEQLAPASVAAPAAPVAAASAPASAASAASSKAAQQQQPQPQPQPALVAAYPQSHPQQLQLQHPQHQHFAHLPAAYPLQQQQQPQPPPQQQQQSFLAPFAASAQPAMFAYPAQFYPVPTTSNQQSTNTGKQRFPSSYPQNSASAGAQNRQSQNRYTVPVQQPLDFTAQLSQQQVPNIQQRDPMQLYSMPTILPNLAVPPLFSNTLAAEYASTANAAGASVLTPEMTWSRVDLPAFVWFELYVRAGAVLSAAAVARELPEGGTFFGWQGQVGVVAPDLMWEAVRDSLARCIPFAQPSAAGQSNHAYSPSNAAPASPSVSTKPATAASTNWGNSGNQSQPSDTVSSIGPLPKVSPLAPVGAAAPPNQNPPTGSSAKNVQKQQHQRPISSQSSHSREADANTSAVSRKSSNNSLAHHNVVMVPNPAARSRHSISSQQSQQQPPSVSGTKLYALDAMDVPIPALVNLPQQFLKDMEDAFGGVRAFCYHVTGPESARVCVAKRGDGFGAGSKALTPKAVKEICEKHGVEFGQIVPFEEAVRMAASKIGQDSITARVDELLATPSSNTGTAPQDKKLATPTASNTGAGHQPSKQQRPYQQRSQQFRTADGVPRSDGAQQQHQQQQQQWQQHQHYAHRGSGSRGNSGAGRGRGRFDSSSGGNFRGGRGRGSGGSGAAETKDASLQSTASPPAAVAVARSEGSP